MARWEPLRNPSLIGASESSRVENLTSRSPSTARSDTNTSASNVEDDNTIRAVTCPAMSVSVVSGSDKKNAPRGRPSAAGSAEYLTEASVAGSARVATPVAASR